MINLTDIKKIEAFKELSETTQSKLLNAGQLVKLKKGEILFWEKDQVDEIYAVLYGKVTMLRYTMTGQKKVIFILDEGNLINEVVFDDFPVSVVCEAFEDTELVKFHKDVFLKLMQDDFELTKKIMCSMGKKQRRLYRQLKNTVAIKIDKKLAAKLWKLSRDYGVSDGAWKRIDLNITVTNLSYMLGSSRETISRALKLLVNLHMVRVDNKKYFVKEEELLKYFKETDGNIKSL